MIDKLRMCPDVSLVSEPISDSLTLSIEVCDVSFMVGDELHIGDCQFVVVSVDGGVVECVRKCS